MTTDSYSSIDAALEILKDSGPEFGVAELANHGPMAAEAMCALGRGGDVVSWVERYRRRLDDHPKPLAAVTHDNWREALGDGSFGGPYQLPDEDVLRVWAAAVEQLRERLESGWP